LTAADVADRRAVRSLVGPDTCDARGRPWPGDGPTVTSASRSD